MKLKVVELRKAKGYSIESMAKEVGCSPTTWGKWEKKPSEIPQGICDKFCKLVGANYDDVIFLP